MSEMQTVVFQTLLTVDWSSYFQKNFRKAEWLVEKAPAPSLQGKKTPVKPLDLSAHDLEYYKLPS